MKPVTITSRSNPEVMFAASLLQKKYREQHGLFVADGIKLFLEAVQSRANIRKVYICETQREALLPIVSSSLGDRYCKNIPVFLLSESAFLKISSENSPQGIITVINSLDIFKKCTKIYKKDFDVAKDERILALCSVRDPGNLGAILRSAVAFGYDRIILSADCAELTSPKTVRAAMGAIFKISLTIVSDFSSLFLSAREADRRILCAELSDRAVSLADLDRRQNDIVVIGNEGHGIPQELSMLADSSVYIPIAPNTESLNAAVAASIFLWELGGKG
jgi:TrmH family RNA methyltransferase